MIPENPAPKAFICFPCVVIRMETLKSGWTPYIYYTTLCSLERAIYAILEKSGEIVVRDSCARNRVEYKV